MWPQARREEGRPRGWGLAGRDEEEAKVGRAIATCGTISCSRSRTTGVCILGEWTGARHTSFAAAYLSTRLSPPHHRS